MTLSKKWAKEWANNAQRKEGRFTIRGDEPMSPPLSLRFSHSVYQWLQQESDRQGIKVQDLVRQCIADKMASTDKIN